MEGLWANMNGSELAGWEIAAVSVDKFVRMLFGPVTCGAGHPAFFGAASITPLSSLGLLKLSDGLILSSLVVNVSAFFMTRNTPLESFWVSPMPERISLWQADVSTFFFRSRASSTLPFMRFLATLALLGMNAQIVLPPKVEEASFHKTTFRPSGRTDVF